MAKPDVTQSPPAADAAQRDGMRLWAPIVAGPLLWTLTELASYWILELSCAVGWLQHAQPVDLPARLLVILISVAALVTLLLAARPAWRSWDRSYDEEARGDMYADRLQFMMLAGLLSTAAFGTAILYHAFASLTVSACAGFTP